MSLVPALCSLFSLLWTGGMLVIIWQTPGVLLFLGVGSRRFCVAREIRMRYMSFCIHNNIILTKLFVKTISASDFWGWLV